MIKWYRSRLVSQRKDLMRDKIDINIITMEDRVTIILVKFNGKE